MTDLSQRGRDILGLLIAQYISSAAPVGSESLAGRTGLSPATIRNAMADMEGAGYLTHPHTSAGRIPTAKGFRYYVDTLLEKRPLTKEECETIRGHYQGVEYSMLLDRTTKLLSAISNYAGLVLSAGMGDTIFKQVEFLRVGTRRVLGIFVTKDGAVRNMFIETGEDFTYPELDKISNYCNSSFYGLTLKDAREKMGRELKREELKYDRLIRHALLWSDELFSSAEGTELLVDGESRLLEAPEFKGHAEKLIGVMQALEEKRKIIHLLDQCAEAQGVKIFIGAESGYKDVADCSIVASNYRRNGKTVGVLGIIGPTRMDYSRVVPVVDFTAQLVGELLG